MGAKLVFGIAMAALILGMMLAAVTLFNSGRQFSESIGNESSKWDLAHTEAQRGLFRLSGLKYISTETMDTNGGIVDCAETTEASMVIDLIVKSSRVPSNCEIFVDRKLFKEIDMNKYSCGFSCPPDEETVISFATENLNIRESHDTEVCCEGYCLEAELAPYCP